MIFSDYNETPSEYNPFCNDTENTSFNECYSHIIPAFFFRNQACPKKPSRFEKKKLRYFYNTTGIILSAKLIIEVSACLLFYILMFLSAMSFTKSTSLYYSVLSDTTVKYAFRTIAVIISTFSVLFAGCRYSSLSLAGLTRKTDGVKTGDVIIFFITGLFITSVQNIINISAANITGNSAFYGVKLEKDICQIVIVCLYTCLIVPLTEGLVFRGLALKNLSRASQRFGIVACSLLCALSTCSPLSIPAAFMMSMLLSVLTVKYNTVIPSVLIHITINICNMIITVYSALLWDSDVFITKMWTAVTFFVGCIAAVIFIIKHPLPKIYSCQRKRSFPLFATSVFIVILIAAYISASLIRCLAFMYL